MSECPKCGAEKTIDKDGHPEWACDSWTFLGGMEETDPVIKQSDKCRIRELEAQNERTQRDLDAALQVLAEHDIELSGMMLPMKAKVPNFGQRVAH